MPRASGPRRTSAAPQELVEVLNRFFHLPLLRYASPRRSLATTSFGSRFEGDGEALMADCWSRSRAYAVPARSGPAVLSVGLGAFSASSAASLNLRP